MRDISNFFEDAAVDMIGEGYFFGSAKSFHAQMKMINYISDVLSDAPLSSLHGEVMLPMLTSYSSQPASIPHLLVLTGQLLLFRCFQAEASMWKAAYPDQARKHSYPYTRYVQSVCMVHVGGTRAVTWSIDHQSIPIQVWMSTELIRTNLFLVF